MSDDKVRANLQPLVELECVDQIHLIRRAHFSMDKITTHNPPSIFNRSLVLSEIYRFFKLFYLSKKVKPDYIYAIYFVPHGIYAALAGWLFDIPVIQELIGTDRPKVENSKFYQSLLSLAKHIGVRGSKSKDALLALGFDRKKIFIPTTVNVLDFNHFKPDNSPKVYDFIYCGRMDKNKQVDLLIQALEQVHHNKPNLRAVLVGDGPERHNLEALCTQLNLGDVITFAGNQPYSAIPSWLNQAKVFMMASAFEGLPVAMIEALCCGLPVVVPDIGDIQDVTVHKHNAWLVTDKTISGYTEGLTSLVHDQQLYERLKQGAIATRTKLIHQYSADNARAIWEDLLFNGK